MSMKFDDPADTDISKAVLKKIYNHAVMVYRNPHPPKKKPLPVGTVKILSDGTKYEITRQGWRKMLA